MRIGINCKYLTVPFSGIGQYTVNFLEPLAKLDTQNEYFLFVNEPVDFDFGKNFKVVVVPEGGISKKQSYFRRLIWEQFKLSRALKRHQIEVYHSLYQTLPNAARNIPSVVTVHDAIPWHFDFQRKDPRYRFYSDYSRWSCKRADKIVTISEYSRIDVTQVYHLKPETIEVIHEGISPRYFERPSDEFINQVRKKFDLPHSYILYVGGLKRHKNLRVLLKSFATLIEEKKIDTHLVLPGSIRKNMAVTSDIYYTVPSLEKYAFEHGVGDRVHFVGYVDFDELNALYHEAKMFVSLSLYEGFGLPALESMAAGVPVIASNITAYPEVLNGAAVLVHPYAIRQVAHYMYKLYVDDNFRKEKIKAGKNRAMDFHREDIANRFIDIYSELYEKKNNQ